MRTCLAHFLDHPDKPKSSSLPSTHETEEFDALRPTERDCCAVIHALFINLEGFLVHELLSRNPCRAAVNRTFSNCANKLGLQSFFQHLNNTDFKPASPHLSVIYIETGSCFPTIVAIFHFAGIFPSLQDAI